MVTAEKDGDVAYIGSDWNEGIMPWAFGLSFDLDQSQPMLRGTVFTDRGVYRLGEEVRLKAILRHNTPQGIRLLPAGHACCFPCATDRIGSSPKERSPSTRGAAPSGRSRCRPRAAWAATRYEAILESDKPVPKKPEDLKPGDEPGPALDDEVAYEKAVHASFLVAAYRRPDFRVDVKLTTGVVKAGDPVKAAVSAKYLFGAPMPARPTTWTWTRSPGGSAPRGLRRAAGWRSVGVCRLGRTHCRHVIGNEPRDEDVADRGAESRPDNQTRRRHPERLHARGGRRGRIPSAHREPRQHHGPSRGLVHRRAPSELFPRSEGWSQDRADCHHRPARSCQASRSKSS